MPRTKELLPPENSATLKFSELIPRLAELQAQGCLVNHLKFLEAGYEIRWIPEEAARRYRTWDQSGSPDTIQARPAPRSENSDRNPRSNNIHQPQLDL